MLLGYVRVSTDDQNLNLQKDGDTLVVWKLDRLGRSLAHLFERSLIQERVKAGLESAKLRGVRGGRPRSIDDEKMIAIKKALEDGMSKAAVCRTFGVKRSTLIDSLNRSE